jgi:NADPH:quinone reductase-like Zn-dependent oxidoreductase
MEREPKAAESAPAIAETMRAAAIDAFGGPDVLSTHSLRVPSPAAHEVLIATHTAGVAPWDAEMRGGWSPTGLAPVFPLVLGTDGSGTIAAVGSMVRSFAVGDRVYAASYPNGGFYAEYIAVSAEHVSHLPSGVDLEHAGAMVNGLTALPGIDDALALQRGEVVAIHGASGSVGTLALQFAKLRGARVFALASGPAGVALVRRLGADGAIDGKTGDVETAARAFAPGGFDAALILAGGPAQKPLLNLLRPGGRVAYPNGVEPAPRARKDVRVIAYDGVDGIRAFKRFNRAVEAAKLEIPIAASFELSDAAKAHERLAARPVLGKIVLRIRNGTEA